MFLTAQPRAPRYPRANDSGYPVVAGRFQPGGPCGSGRDCEDSAQKPAAYLDRDLEARPALPSAFRAMSGLGSSNRAFLRPTVRGDWGPGYAARQQPTTAPETSRPEGFHGLGSVTVPPVDPLVARISNMLAAVSGSSFAANGLHRMHIIQTVLSLVGQKKAFSDYRTSVCAVSDTGDITPGGGDAARLRSIINIAVGAAGAVASAIPGALASDIATALRTVAGETDAVDAEIMARCEIIAAEHRGSAVVASDGDAEWVDMLVRRGLTPAHALAVARARTAKPPMATGTKVAIAAGGLALIGAIVWAVAR